MEAGGPSSSPGVNTGQLGGMPNLFSGTSNNNNLVAGPSGGDMGDIAGSSSSSLGMEGVSTAVGNGQLNTQPTPTLKVPLQTIGVDVPPQVLKVRKRLVEGKTGGGGDRVDRAR